MDAPAIYATLAVIGWVASFAWTLYSTIQQDGSWYNELKMEGRDTFENRAIVTFRNRIHPLYSMAYLVLGAIAIWIVVYIFAVGFIEVVA